MNNLIETFISSEVINALGYTFLHSLWQGPLLAGLLYFIFSRKPDITPTTKSNLGLIGLIAISVLAFNTFTFYYIQALNVPHSILHTFEITASTYLAGGSEGSIMVSPDLSFWIQDQFAWITVFWIIGIFCFSIRLIFGWLHLRG